MRCRVSPRKSMTIRLFGALLCGATLLTSRSRAISAQGHPALRTRGTTVGSKANTSDRKGRGRRRASNRATTVKSSKSNTSDRMGGGGHKGQGSRARWVTSIDVRTQTEYGRATTGKSSKSNTGDRTVTMRERGVRANQLPRVEAGLVIYRPPVSGVAPFNPRLVPFGCAADSLRSLPRCFKADNSRSPKGPLGDVANL